MPFRAAILLFGALQRGGHLLPAPAKLLYGPGRLLLGLL
jgi:hypothetical protein